MNYGEGEGVYCHVMSEITARSERVIRTCRQAFRFAQRSPRSLTFIRPHHRQGRASNTPPNPPPCTPHCPSQAGTTRAPPPLSSPPLYFFTPQSLQAPLPAPAGRARERANTTKSSARFIPPHVRPQRAAHSTIRPHRDPISAETRVFITAPARPRPVEIHVTCFHITHDLRLTG